MAGFLALVGGMQLWEALLWRNIGGGCTPTNGALSNAGAINNHLEPVALYLMCTMLLAPRSPLKANVAGAVMVAYVLLFGVLTAKFVRRPLTERCTRLSRSGLVWQWNEHGTPANTNWAYALFVVALVTTMYAYMPPGVDIALPAVTVASLVASRIVYGGKGMVGSMWCFFAALLPWITLACA